MGDPRKKHNLFKRPLKMWDSERMVEESVLVKEYGLRRKKELWRTNGLVSKFASKAKILIKAIDEHSDKDKAFLVSKLQSYGVLSVGSKVEDVLAIKMRDFLERRLQTVVFRKGLAKTMLQSRQFIVHGHIKVNNNVVIAPSYLVTKNDEAKIVFNDFSAMVDENHPERFVAKKEVSEPVVKDKKIEAEKKPYMKKRVLSRNSQKHKRTEGKRN